MKKLLSELKASSATTLALQGPTAAAAVDCMRKDGAMSSKPAFGDDQFLAVKSNGADIEIQETQNLDSRFGDMASSAITTLTPASKSEPATMQGPNATVIGPGADVLRQRAVSCAFKALKLTP